MNFIEYMGQIRMRIRLFLKLLLLKTVIPEISFLSRCAEKTS